MQHAVVAGQCWEWEGWTLWIFSANIVSPAVHSISVIHKRAGWCTIPCDSVFALSQGPCSSCLPWSQVRWLCLFPRLGMTPSADGQYRKAHGGLLLTNSVLQKGRFHHTPTIKQKPCAGVGEVWLSPSVGAHHTENQFSSALQGLESIRDTLNHLLGSASCCHSLSTSTACSRFSPTEAWSQNLCQLLCSESNLQLASHLQLPGRRGWTEHT